MDIGSAGEASTFPRLFATMPPACNSYYCKLLRLIFVALLAGGAAEAGLVVVHIGACSFKQTTLMRRRDGVPDRFCSVFPTLTGLFCGKLGERGRPPRPSPGTYTGASRAKNMPDSKPAPDRPSRARSILDRSAQTRCHGTLGRRGRGRSKGAVTGHRFWIMAASARQDLGVEPASWRSFSRRRAGCKDKDPSHPFPCCTALPHAASSYARAWPDLTG